MPNLRLEVAQCIGGSSHFVEFVTELVVAVEQPVNIGRRISARDETPPELPAGGVASARRGWDVVRAGKKMPGAFHPFTLACCIVIVCLLCPFDAYAYIGPGAGLSAIGSLVALVAAVFIGILGFVWFPIKRLMRRMKSRSSQGSKPSAATPGETPPKAPLETHNDQGT